MFTRPVRPRRRSQDKDEEPAAPPVVDGGASVAAGPATTVPPVATTTAAAVGKPDDASMFPAIPSASTKGGVSPRRVSPRRGGGGKSARSPVKRSQAAAVVTVPPGAADNASTVSSMSTRLSSDGDGFVSTAEPPSDAIPVRVPAYQQSSTVEGLLTQAGLSQYTDAIIDAGYDTLERLALLDKGDLPLAVPSMKLGHQRQLLHIVARIAATTTA